jgi:hypothetical protein
MHLLYSTTRQLTCVIYTFFENSKRIFHDLEIFQSGRLHEWGLIGNTYDQIDPPAWSQSEIETTY